MDAGADCQRYAAEFLVYAEREGGELLLSGLLFSPHVRDRPYGWHLTSVQVMKRNFRKAIDPNRHDG